MKRFTIIHWLLTIGLIVSAVHFLALIVWAQPILDVEPDAIAVKPVLVSVEKPWNGSFYQVVKMVGGGRQRLKSRKSLTPKQWQEKADKVQAAIDAEPGPEKTCEECHDGCGRRL